MNYDDKIPPQDIGMEMATLGAMILERQAIEAAASILRPEDFRRDANATIYNAILRMEAANEPVDLLSLQTQLRHENKLEQCGGAPYLYQLTDALPTAANVVHYARIVREKAVARRLLDLSQRIPPLVHSDYDDIESVVNEVEKMTLAVTGDGRISEGLVGARPMVAQAFEALEYQSEGHKPIIYPTGLTHLDHMLGGGMCPGEMIVIGGRPSMGKSSLAMWIASNTARAGKTTAVFAMETDRQRLMTRLILSEARVDTHQISTGASLMDYEWQRIGSACADISLWPLWIDDSAQQTIVTIRSRARRLQTEHGLALIVVDYLQKLKPHKKAENRNREVGEMASGLKDIARELDVPILVCVQVGRSVQTRADKRPLLSDLKESGEVEQEADKVLFPYRPAYYEKKTDQNRDTTAAEPAEMIVAKNRMGPTGTARMVFVPAYATFGDITDRYGESG
jgi:replicative DNA helicase